MMRYICECVGTPCSWIMDRIYFVTLGLLIGLGVAPFFGVDVFVVIETMTGYCMLFWQKVLGGSLLGVLTVYSIYVSGRAIEKPVFRMSEQAILDIESLEKSASQDMCQAERCLCHNRTMSHLAEIKDKYKTTLKSMDHVGST